MDNDTAIQGGKTFEWGTVHTLLSTPGCQLDSVQGIRGKEAPRHLHTSTVNVIIVVSGIVRMTLFHDVFYNIRAADCFSISPGKAHRIRSEADDTVYYEMFYPAKGGTIDLSDIDRN